MLYHVIIIKTKVILPLGIGDLGRFGISCLGPLVFLLPKTFKLFGFQIFRLWAYLMKVIPGTRRVRTNFDFYVFFILW
jgi:hypothetical protein